MQTAAERNIAILCNPLAGAGEAVILAGHLANELSVKQIRHQLYVEKWPAGLHGYTDIWIAGGDGTLNFFINHYPAINLPLVIFRGGTGNDFHWLLYGKKTVEEQVKIAIEGNPKPIDIGTCNDRFFINGAGIGFEGEVARALTGKKKLPGKTSFLITILGKIFSYRCKEYVIRSESFSTEGKKLLIDISNGCRAGGGFHIAPEARPDDGFLDVVIAGPLNPLQRLRYLPVIEKGKHLHRSFIRHFYATEISVESNTFIQYHLDGEYHTANRIDAGILPARLLFRY